MRCAAEQGLILAQEGLGDNKNNWLTKQEDARWLMRAAEQGHQRSIDKIHEKSDPFLLYHSHMLQLNVPELASLIAVNSNPEFLDEVIFDLNCESAPSAVKETALEVIHQLITLTPDSMELRSILNDYHLGCLLKIHQEKNQFNEAYDPDSLSQAYSDLSKINAADVSMKQINPLINLLTELWYASKTARMEAKMTALIGPFLHALLFRLNSTPESGAVLGFGDPSLHSQRTSF